jgi:GT2 family glycosyltransferase
MRRSRGLRPCARLGLSNYKRTAMSYVIADIEITQPLPTIVTGEGDTGIALIVRQAGRPIDFIMHELPAQHMFAPADLTHLLAEVIDAQQPEEPKVTPPISDTLAELPSVTVAICTRDNPQNLANCLKHLLSVRSAAPEAVVEILVVDNAPSDGQTRDLVAAILGIDYVMEPKPGLDFARNRAIQAATGEIVTFVDDDVIVDQHWLKALYRTLIEHPDAAAVTGLVLPAELNTEAQILFEKRGGFEKKLTTTRYGRTLPGHPFYPCLGGKFGTGCNMAFRRQVLLELGGFDEALDTGPALPGGGDTDMFYRVVRAGYPLIYEPQFLVFHTHRRELWQLRRQYSHSWGRGLMAYVAKTYRYDTAQRPNLRRLVAWWFGNQLHELVSSIRGKHVLPPDMILAELWGGIVGLCGAYDRSLRRTDRIRRRYSAHLNVATNPSV